jgi:molybdopterin converting factor small subunit
MVRRIEIRYYAQLRDALGSHGEEVELDLPAAETAVLEALAARHPRQRELFLASRVAVADGYLEGDAVPADASGLDIISPISGG